MPSLQTLPPHTRPGSKRVDREPPLTLKSTAPTALSRIRRSDTVPGVFADEMRSVTRYRRRINCRVGDRLYPIIYRRSRGVWLGAEPDTIRHREVFAWILRGGARIGCIRLNEYAVHADLSNEAFLERMGAESASAQALAAALCEREVDDFDGFGRQGSILELSAIWIDRKHAKTAIWIPALKALVVDSFGDATMLVLKAFPLEYWNIGVTDPERYRWFRRRQAAMCRYYASKLNVRTLPGRAGREGWMARRISETPLAGTQKPR